MPKAQLEPWLAVVGAVVVIILFIALLYQPKPWPFKKLRKWGQFQTSIFPTGDGLDERKRDFGRITGSKDSGLYVVTPTEAVPKAWSHSVETGGNIDKDAAEKIFAEFERWLEGVLKGASIEQVDGLSERCVAMLAVSNGVEFATKHEFPMMMKQPKFVLVVSSAGEVRVTWFTFITDAVKADMEAGPYMVKMVSCDLNSSPCEATATKNGVPCDYVANPTRAKDMAAYVQQQAAAFSRAAVENHWNDILA